MARVNAFLFLLRAGRPENAAYVSDNDLLPEDHPLSTRPRTLTRNLNGPAAIVVDIDDTLFRADGSPIENVVRFVDDYEGEVLIVTARRERRREETIGQLKAVDIDPEYLYMRDSAMPEVAYKSEMVKDLLDVWNIELAIENNPDVRAEYARLGITTLEPGAVDPEELPQMIERAEERAVDLTLPEYIRDAAARGVQYYEDGLGGDGLIERTIREARLMAEGQISEDKVMRRRRRFGMRILSVLA
jgi:hypothetical protein